MSSLSHSKVFESCTAEELGSSSVFVLLTRGFDPAETGCFLNMLLQTLFSFGWSERRESNPWSVCVAAQKKSDESCSGTAASVIPRWNAPSNQMQRCSNPPQKQELNLSSPLCPGESDAQRLAGDFGVCRRPGRDARGRQQRRPDPDGEGWPGLPQTGERKPNGRMEILHLLRLPGVPDVEEKRRKMESSMKTREKIKGHGWDGGGRKRTTNFCRRTREQEGWDVFWGKQSDCRHLLHLLPVHPSFSSLCFLSGLTAAFGQPKLFLFSAEKLFICLFKSFLKVQPSLLPLHSFIHQLWRMFFHELHPLLSAHFYCLFSFTCFKLFIFCTNHHYCSENIKLYNKCFKFISF